MEQNIFGRLIHKTNFLPFRNHELPHQFQLLPDAFQMTSFTYDSIEATIEAKLKSIQAANQEETKESLSALEKVRERFFEDLIFPRVVVKGIR